MPNTPYPLSLTRALPPPPKQALAAAPELAPQRATYRANLAAAYCKTGQHALAVEQATCALRGDPKCALSSFGFCVLF